LVVWKMWLLLRNMIKILCTLCFWNVITICILWLNLKVILLTKDLMKTTTNFEITIINTSEQTKALINTKFYIFKWYQMNMKDIKCHFHWWEKHPSMFSTIGLFNYQILKIIIHHKLRWKDFFYLVRVFD